MFITRKSLSRRTVLRSIGATVGLPFLEAMVPALANAQALQTPLRFGAVYVPNGCPMEWQNLHPKGGAYVSLPPYPWQHERFWLDDGPAGRAGREGGRQGHPLLGRHFASALHAGTHHGQTTLDAADLPLYPWHVAPKHRFVRVLPELVTGRRFRVADRVSAHVGDPPHRRAAPE